MEGRHVLLVEGTSDYGAVRNLWLKHHPDAKDAFGIEVRFGIENVREAFRGSLLASDIDRLGVIVDADTSIASRWPAFYQYLVERNYRPVPKELPAQGLILHRPDNPVPKVGVWIMPDNASAGRLEDFVTRLVRPDDELWDHAGRVIRELPSELTRFKPQHHSKAHLYTWLAWQKEPGLRAGPAVERGLLDAGAQDASALVSWLKRLFVEDVARSAGATMVESTGPL
jgi:hypothetical protein